jgi:Xaa-Pro aminopeptidase
MSREAAPPLRGFNADEFGRRLSRAQDIMRRHDFDALLFTTPHNFRWATGFASQFWESPTRPWFIILPAGGEPVAVIPEIGAPNMAETWISDIRSWPAPQPEDDGTSLLVSAIEALPRRFGRVGMELGREHALRMPVTQFLELRDQLSGIELADGSSCIWQIRMVKTEAEIAHIRHICQIASDGW